MKLLWQIDLRKDLRDLLLPFRLLPNHLRRKSLSRISRIS